MANPLFQQIGVGMMPGPMGNMQQMMQQFQKFQQNFKGNPQQAVQQMLQSGQITQAQFNQAHAMAQQFLQFLR